MHGRFITIEGQDGAGKSTNLHFIESYLKSLQIDVHTTREPGGTQLGEQLREVLLYGTQLGVSDLAELLLMFAARAQHLNEIIYPALNAGKWVVSDRFTDATYAYQGAGRGMPYDQIELLEKVVQEGFQPDLTLLLDVPLKTAKSRGANNEQDRFEQQQDSFKVKVREYYLSLSESQPDRVKRIDASLPLKHVQAQIKYQLDQLIEAT